MPAYNEETHIAESIEATKNALGKLGLDYEIVVVDDGSTDSTLKSALSLADSRVKVVGYKQNWGKGFALKYGFSHTTGDVVAFIDSDNDISKDQLNGYLAVIQKADVLIASKRHPASRTGMPLSRKFLSIGFHLMVRLLTGLKVSDTQTGLKAFRRDVLKQILPKLSVKRFAFDVELLAVANLYGFRMVEMPITIDMPRVEPLRVLRMLLSMLREVLGVAYRLRILKCYQPNSS